MIEHGIDKLDVQPLVQVSDYVDPADDDSTPQATGAVVVLDTQDGSPIDGDVPTFVAGSPNKFKPMVGGTASMVPTYIAPGQTYQVPANRQALYTIPIINDGTIAIGANAYLVLVD